MQGLLPFTSQRPGKAFTILLNFAILAGWLWLYRSVFPYLAVIFSRQEFRTNQILLLVSAALIIGQVSKGVFRPQFAARAQFYPPAITMLLGSSVIYLVVERYLDINTLSASLFALAGYGLLGLWISPVTWRYGLAAALLLIGALPFGEHMQTFIGYPVRIITASIVNQGLSGLGAPAISIDTILVFENGISQVDLPCSGIKSLWTGGLFLLAATWIERRPINMRWVGIAVLFTGILLVANLLRVAILVIVGQVLDWRLLAEMLHVPLGVLAFCIACLLALALLRRQTPPPLVSTESPTATTSLLHPGWLAPMVSTSLFILALLYTPRPQSNAVAAVPKDPASLFPPELSTISWPFTPGELKWLNQGEAGLASRWHFKWHDTAGSILFMSSTSWRAQHKPERCFEVYGLTIQDSQPHLVTQDFPIRLVALGKSDDLPLYSAVYWFQSTGRTTEDYATRIWADLAPQRHHWVLVTILFDKPLDPGDPELTGLYEALHDSIQTYLEGG